jgi:hypothetical protein
MERLAGSPGTPILYCLDNNGTIFLILNSHSKNNIMNGWPPPSTPAILQRLPNYTLNTIQMQRRNFIFPSLF